MGLGSIVDDYRNHLVDAKDIEKIAKFNNDAFGEEFGKIFAAALLMHVLAEQSSLQITHKSSQDFPRDHEVGLKAEADILELQVAKQHLRNNAWYEYPDGRKVMMRDRPLVIDKDHGLGVGHHIWYWDGTRKGQQFRFVIRFRVTAKGTTIEVDDIAPK